MNFFFKMNELFFKNPLTFFQIDELFSKFVNFFKHSMNFFLFFKFDDFFIFNEIFLKSMHYFSNSMNFFRYTNIFQIWWTVFQVGELFLKIDELGWTIAWLAQCMRSKPIQAKNKYGRPSIYGLRVGSWKSSKKWVGFVISSKI